MMMTPSAKLALLILGIFFVIILVSVLFRSQIGLFIDNILKLRAQTQQSTGEDTSV